MDSPFSFQQNKAIPVFVAHGRKERRLVMVLGGLGAFVRLGGLGWAVLGIVFLAGAFETSPAILSTSLLQESICP
jgi:hypothetical protein